MNEIVIALNNLTKQVYELSCITELLVEELQDLNFNMNTGVKYIVESDLEKELHNE